MFLVRYLTGKAMLRREIDAGKGGPRGNSYYCWVENDTALLPAGGAACAISLVHTNGDRRTGDPGVGWSVLVTWVIQVVKEL